jgi:hypothetical protein
MSMAICLWYAAFVPVRLHCFILTQLTLALIFPLIRRKRGPIKLQQSRHLGEGAASRSMLTPL